jgi:cytidylate kinase
MAQQADTSDEALIAARAAEPVIEVSADPDDPWTRVNGTDVSKDIRTVEVSSQVSVVARVPAVREHLIARQRAIIAEATGGIVAEGRDIGTVVAPGAQLKVFLTASAKERARRRAAELQGDPSVVLAEQVLRDARDTTRAHSPLQPAPDAVELDTTGLTADEAVDEIVALARARGG